MNGLNAAQRLNDLNVKNNQMPSFIIIALLAFVLVTPALAHDGDRQKALLDSVTIEERLDNQLPLDLALRDETGAAVTLRRYFTGKPVLLAFVYYDCPQLCPLVLEGLGRSLRVLRLAGEDYQVIAVSIDPTETAALAARKKKALHGAASWHFLTAPVQTIDALTQAAGFRYRPSQSAGKESFIHAANTLVLTPEGRISRYFSSIDFPPKELRFALIEASGNRVGSPLDHLLLLCYRYDPAQGRYTLAILNVLRLSALITVAAVGGFIAIMLLRERRKTA
ncbi:MAG: SCO family protein [Candidatus Binatia bacterium]